MSLPIEGVATATRLTSPITDNMGTPQGPRKTGGSTPADVAFGAGGHFKFKYGQASPVACNDATFGDPDVGVVKGCYIKPDVGPRGYFFGATEGHTCFLARLSTVAFGANGRFFFRVHKRGVIN